MYYALYRKYRPQTFDKVVGQDAITETLKNQIKTSHISHSYLFTGTRGTGKTTCAKIFARAVNCERPVDGNPCNECPTCRGLLDGSNYAVTEMDAASNNSVDDIRKIIDEVLFPPMDAKYRVYIIDEVHMLSSGAFNALLKTIEEPPEHALFILATTEIQKVPATVRSRCQRFDFARMSRDVLKEYIRDIVTAEGKTLDDKSLDIVATLGDGSARDSLSVLEKVIDIKDEEQVRKVLGVCDENELFGLSAAVAAADIDAVYGTVADFYASSKEFGILCADLSAFYRKLLIARTTKSPAKLLEISEEEAARYKEESNKYTVERIIFIMNCLRDNYALLKQSLDKRTDMEVCLLRCALPRLGTDTNALAARLSALEAKADNVALSSQNRQEAPAAQQSQAAYKHEQPEAKDSAQLPVPNGETDTRKEPENETSRLQEQPREPEQKAAAVTAAHQGKGGYKLFVGFDDAVREIGQTDIFLSKNLRKNCKALIKDKDILLVFSSITDKNDAQSEGGPGKIRKAVDNLHMQDSRIVMTVGSAEEYLGEQSADEIVNDTGLFTE